MKNELSLDSLFGDQKIDFACPDCHHEFEVEFSEIVNDKSIIVCPNCKVNIEVNHDETTKTTLNDSSKALGEFNKSLSDLEKTMKKFGK